MHENANCISLRFILTGVAGKEVGDEGHIADTLDKTGSNTLDKTGSNVVTRVKTNKRKWKTGPHGRTAYTTRHLKRKQQ